MLIMSDLQVCNLIGVYQQDTLIMAIIKAVRDMR